MTTHPALYDTLARHGWRRWIDTVQCCDALDLLRALPEGCVDAVVTDPPYPEEYLHTYETVARESQRVLKPGGSLVAMAGQSYLPEILRLMTPHLTYQWMLNYFMPGDSTQIWKRKVLCQWKPVLWFTKGEYDGPWVFDVVKSPQKSKGFHVWGQGLVGTRTLVERFTQKGDLVVEPFCGGGTTVLACRELERNFIACDVDPEAVATARRRLALPWQPALFAA